MTQYAILRAVSERPPFIEQIQQGWEARNSLLCVGLDPDLNRLPAQYRDGANRIEDGMLEFCRDIVDATADLVCAFKPQIAYFVNELGNAVIAPNVRGSSGYGKSYLKLDNGYNRENTVKGIGKLLEWIEADPELDENRVAVYGGSYGGYMVLSSMVNFNEKLACGIDVVGISNFITFLENTEEYRRDLRRVEYGDERDPKMREFLTSISPNLHVDKITKPILIAQGANDPRVPASESEQMVQAIRDNDGTVWYMLAKDEGHGFQKKENNDMLREAIALFLVEYLLKE